MGDKNKSMYNFTKNIKITIKTLRYFWIISLFLSPVVGLFSILIISYVTIYFEIDWNTGFTGKKINKNIKS